MRAFYCLILIIFISEAVIAQSGTSVFNDTILHIIQIQTSESNWYEKAEINYSQNLKDPVTYPEVSQLCNVWMDGVLMDSCGIREKGNYSNYSHSLSKKKPFKLSFDAFKDQKYDGLNKLNLNNGTDDPSFLREALVYKLLRNEGLPAPRTMFAKIYINDKYWGLYEIVENVDKAFLKDHYGKKNNDGNLYKTKRGAAVTLEWAGKDSSAYIETGLLLKRGADTTDWDNMIHFIDVINHTEKDKLKDDLGNIFDVENYLKYLAVEKLVNSWDSYWGGGNNFYLYEHPDGKIRWLPWDFNETFQTHNGILKAILPSEKYIIPTDRFDKRPLLRSIFSVPEWKQMYLDDVCSMLSNKYQTEKIVPELLRWQDLIREALSEDNQKLNPMEYFEVGLTEPTTEKISFPKTGLAFDVTFPGLIPFIAERRVWAAEQLKAHEQDCSFVDSDLNNYSLEIYPNPLQSILNINLDNTHINYSEIVVYNLIGEIVYQSDWKNNTGNKMQINLSFLQQGYYLIMKKDADGRFGVGKFVKVD